MNVIVVGDVLAVAWCVWFCHFYGVVENRWFREAGEAVVLNHFKAYHVFWLVPLFSFHAFVLAHSLQSLLGLSMLQAGLLFAGWACYGDLGLDWVWWVIRWLDFRRDPQAAAAFYHEPNAWHRLDGSDWDAGGLGVFRVGGSCVFRWWPICGILSALLIACAFFL